MAKLKQWRFFKCYDSEQAFQAEGYVYDSPKFYDGKHIYTSKVQQIKNNDAEECLEVHTMNSVYYCYWEDCDFENAETAEYWKDFLLYRKQYIDDKLQPLEENNILLLHRENTGIFRHAFIQRKGELRRIGGRKGELGRIGDNTYIYQSHYLIRSDSEETDAEIDIRYVRMGEYGYKLYYADIPEDTTLYLENMGASTMEIECGKQVISVNAKERVKLECLDVADYMEFAKGNEPLPKAIERFSKEKVLRDIQSEPDAAFEKNYMIIQTVDIENESGEITKRTRVCVTNGVGMMICMDEYEQAKKLLEGCATFELDAPIRVLYYDINGKQVENLECKLLDFMVYDWEMPEHVYSYFWQKAKENCIWPLKSKLDLKVVFERKKDSALMQCVQRLQGIWEAAADEMLLSLIRYFLITDASISEPIWEEMFKVFGNKRRSMIMEIIGYYVHSDNTELSRSYTKQIQDSICCFWKLYQRYEGGETAKETVIYVLKEAREKNYYGWENCMEWFIIMLLEGMVEFGDLLIEERDQRIHGFLKDNIINRDVWKLLIRSGFMPMQYLDFYIEDAKICNVEAIVPILIAAKYSKD